MCISLSSLHSLLSLSGLPCHSQIPANFSKVYITPQIIIAITGDKLVLITSPNCPLLKKKEIKLSDISAYPLLMRDRGSAGRTFAQRVLEANSVPFEITWESVSTQALVKAVHNDLGISLLPEELVKADIKSKYVCTVPICDVDLSRKYWICYNNDKFLTLSMKEIARALTITKEYRTN